MEINTMKRIQLVTFFPHANYGTCLQSYALCYFLREKGYRIGFIEERIFGGYKGALYRLLNSRPLRWLYLRIRRRFYKDLQNRKIFDFTYMDDNYEITTICNKRQYHSLCKKTDVFLTGSDQIWNPYCAGFIPFFFLDFAEDKKRVSYSSSISRPSIPEEFRDKMKFYLSKFSKIAVREQKSVELLSELLGRDDIQLVVDPVCLLSKQEWNDFGNRCHLEFDLPEKYIFCYFVGFWREDDYLNMVSKAKEVLGINQVVVIGCHKQKPLDIPDAIKYEGGGPYEFVHLLMNSYFLCTDSFHATLLALKFGVNFGHVFKDKVETNESQNTRMYDLLNRYGLMSKIYDSMTEKWIEKPDFDRVQNILENDIKESVTYLINAVEC